MAGSRFAGFLSPAPDFVYILLNPMYSGKEG